MRLLSDRFKQAGGSFTEHTVQQRSSLPLEVEGVQSLRAFRKILEKGKKLGQKGIEHNCSALGSGGSSTSDGSWENIVGMGHYVLTVFLHACPGLQDKLLSQPAFGSELGVLVGFFLFPALPSDAASSTVVLCLWRKWVTPVSRHCESCYSGVGLARLVFPPRLPPSVHRCLELLVHKGLFRFGERYRNE